MTHLDARVMSGGGTGYSIGPYYPRKLLSSDIAHIKLFSLQFQFEGSDPFRMSASLMLHLFQKAT